MTDKLILGHSVEYLVAVIPFPMPVNMVIQYAQLPFLGTHGQYVANSSIQSQIMDPNIVWNDISMATLTGVSGYDGIVHVSSDTSKLRRPSTKLNVFYLIGYSSQS